MTFHPKQLLLKTKEGHYAIATWPFWRTLFVVFCVFCWVGRWMEIPYINFMGIFGIVDPTYAGHWEPWFCPYWVYGIGVVCITLVLEPWKEHIQRRRKTVWGAFLETFVYITILAAVLETVIGLLINQWDPNLWNTTTQQYGAFPYWDNSQLPLNILGQGWLVNDLLLGIMGSLYLWLFYPVINGCLSMFSEKIANCICAVVVLLLIVSALFSYVFV